MSRALHMTLLIILVGFGIGSAWAEDRDVEAYPMDKEKYESLKPTLESLKSKNGKMSYVNGKLLVVDLPKVQKLVQEIIAKTATPAVNVSVHVTFQNLTMIRDRGLTVSGTFKSVRTGGRGPKIKGSVDIDVKDQKKTVDRKNSMSLMVSSGKAAELWNTKTVLDTAALKRYGLIPLNANEVAKGVVRRPPLPKDFVRAIGSSMWIKPTYMTNGLVQVEVFPVVRAEMRDGSEKYFRVSSVQTSVTVQPKRQLFIGGTNASMREYFRNLFGVSATSKTSTDSLSIAVMAEVQIMDPATRKRSGSPRPHGDPIWRNVK